ncbi:acyl-CoA thioesterase [Nitrosopumilus sp.]|uniref:acyl-CoA thioesterase n=1 Tax=Nitrosopumilus sp. TaxID=2024843 RepID=UPI00247C51D4|nr:acyl-CoA thioesterase [Nitrosopumilus sp.]MCV0430965.1 acyl-CoA thioesterase [Nitrosopumilus sp.]
MSSENSIDREKSPAESHAEVIVRMFPSDANPAGNVFGGEILKHIDMVAGIVAQRHSQSNAVTVSMDSVNFLKPVFVGNVLSLNARINYVHNSSMEIEVKAEAEDIVTGIRTVTGTAFVTFVALDKNGKPTPVPKLALKTDDDRIKFEEGKVRMDNRLKKRQN